MDGRVGKLGEHHYHHLVLTALRSALAGRRRVRLHVRGTSMAPWLGPGDVLVVEPVRAGALRPGDLVVRCDGETCLVHRLIAYDARRGLWYTKGDDVSNLDPPLPSKNLVGRVVAVERNGRRQELSTRRAATVGRLLAEMGRLEARMAAWPVPRPARRWARALHRGVRAVLTRLF